MKTTAIRIAFVAMVILTTGIFSVSAQETSEFFFDKKRNDQGQLTSKTKFELQDCGLFDKTYKSEYFYNDLGKVTKEEGYKWNANQSKWQPTFCITHTYDLYENRITVEYATWNKKKGQYNEVSEKAIYWLDESGKFISYVMMRDKDNILDKITLAN